MELWAAFILGLAGSAHCAGMCGPLVLALPGSGDGAARQLGGRLAYNAGRVLTYCALGLVFGVIGQSLAVAGVQRWTSIALGAAVLAGLMLWRTRFLNLVPTGQFKGLKSAFGRVLQRRSAGSLFMLGLCNGLLPCGLVYVAGAGAAASGSLLGGVSFMAAFGLGTVPMMLALALAGGWLKASLRLRLQKLIPVSVGLLAVLLILRGMALGIPYLSPDLTAAPAANACCH